MRRWIALLIGTAALVLAGTAMALDGSDEAVGAELATTTTTLEAKERFTKPVEFAPIPKGMLVEDDLPEKVEVEKPPVDETPPEIEILHPEDGQVFEVNEVVFEGETEPGAKVYAGDKEADVSEAGAWRIVLVLDKGENLVTVKAIDEAGNYSTDSVEVIYEAPKPEPKEEKPKEEPKKEQPKKEQPKEEEPKKEEPKEDKPKEEPKDEEPVKWEFSAKQVFGSCGETPPYDVFHGTGKPGTLIHIESEFGGGVAEIGEKGHWEIKVIFETAPVGKVFPVYVKDDFGNKKVFEFVHTDIEH